MRTTVTLDDRVYAQIRVLAAQSNTSVSSVIEEAMRAYLLDRHDAPTRPAVALPTMNSGGAQPGVDLDDLSSVYEVLDEGRSIDDLR